MEEGEAQKVEENKRWGDKRKGKGRERDPNPSEAHENLHLEHWHQTAAHCCLLLISSPWAAEGWVFCSVGCHLSRLWESEKRYSLVFPEISCTADFKWITSRYYTVTEFMSSLICWLIVILFWNPIDMRNIFILSGSLGMIISVWRRQQSLNEQSITVPSLHHLQPTQQQSQQPPQSLQAM